MLQVLYLVFNEGYTASSGATLAGVELSDEAIRLTRQVARASCPIDGEVQRPARADAAHRRPAAGADSADGSLVSLAEQDRSTWDRAAIAEGAALVSACPRTSRASARIRCRRRSPRCMTRRPSVDETDWPQILALYDMLARIAPGPMVTLNRIVALTARSTAYDVALHELDLVQDEPTLASHHRMFAVRAHLLERDRRRAKRPPRSYEVAASRTLSLPEQQYLRAGPGRAPAASASLDTGSRRRLLNWVKSHGHRQEDERRRSRRRPRCPR